MPRVLQQGKGRDRIVTQGERVTTTKGINGTITLLGGGSHQYAAIKDDAGHTYCVDTQDIK